MRKSLVLGLFVVLSLAVVVTAFAADGETVNAWQGFWNSVGGFVYNALPWNWGNWMGK